MPRGQIKQMREQQNAIPLPEKLPKQMLVYLHRGYVYDGRHLIGPVRKDGTRGIILWPVKNFT